VVLTIKEDMKIVKYIWVFCFLVSCGDAQVKSEKGVSINIDTTITKKDISELNYNEFILDSKAASKIKDWEKYFELDAHVVHVTQNDLSFFRGNSENLTAFINDLKASVPEQLNVPSILVRLKAIETKMLKLEGTIILSNASKQDLLYNIQEFLISFSNLNFQINKKFEKESQNIQKPQ
jgi:hypothetical protein